MTYYKDFQSYKDVLEGAKSFSIMVTDNLGQVINSSMIPIEVLEDIQDEIEIVLIDQLGFSIWVRSGNSGKIVSFLPGTISKIQIDFYQ